MVDEAGYGQAVRNRRRYEAYRLTESRSRPGASPVARVVRRAAAVLRSRERAQAAWEQVVQARWREQSSIVGWEDGQLVIRVTSQAVRFELSRIRQELLQQLARRLPGVRNIRIEVY